MHRHQRPSIALPRYKRSIKDRTSLSGATSQQKPASERRILLLRVLWLCAAIWGELSVFACSHCFGKEISLTEMQKLNLLVQRGSL